MMNIPAAHASRPGPSTQQPSLRTTFEKRTRAGAAAFAAMLLVGTAQAALEDRDLNGDAVTDAFYDTVLDITWLRDANVNGPMNWDAAVAWAADYSIADYSDWRLPASDNCSGYNCIGSEMGHLWYVDLGNVAGLPMTNTGDFQNLSNSYYWTSKEYAPWSTLAWYFFMYNGFQNDNTSKSNLLLSMAVRDGDVAAIPEPETFALMLAGLVTLAAVRRR